MTFYVIQYADTGVFDEQELSEAEWFQVFLSGTYLGRPLVSIERSGAPSKRVLFEEYSIEPKQP